MNYDRHPDEDVLRNEPSKLPYLARRFTVLAAQTMPKYRLHSVLLIVLMNVKKYEQNNFN